MMPWNSKNFVPHKQKIRLFKRIFTASCKNSELAIIELRAILGILVQICTQYHVVRNLKQHFVNYGMIWVSTH